jgi:hypothetical protein
MSVARKYIRRVCLFVASILRLLRTLGGAARGDEEGEKEEDGRFAGGWRAVAIDHPFSGQCRFPTVSACVGVCMCVCVCVCVCMCIGLTKKLAPKNLCRTGLRNLHCYGTERASCARRDRFSSRNGAPSECSLARKIKYTASIPPTPGP